MLLVLHMTLWIPVGGNVARVCSDSYSLSLCEYKYVLASATACTHKSASILLRVQVQVLERVLAPASMDGRDCE